MKNSVVIIDEGGLRLGLILTKLFVDDIHDRAIKKYSLKSQIERSMELFENNGAEFSADRMYRYCLWRIWDQNKPIVMFIGLNPSTANETKPDRTITRIKKIVTNLGYGGFYMLNLFAVVSKYPKVLKTHLDPLGDNDGWLEKIAPKCEKIFFAWGNFKEARERAEKVKKMFPNSFALHINKNGSPKHPLYIKGDVVPVEYPNKNKKMKTQFSEQKKRFFEMVSVKDRLPIKPPKKLGGQQVNNIRFDYGIEKIVMLEDGSITIFTFHYGNKKWYAEWDGQHFLDEVKHRDCTSYVTHWLEDVSPASITTTEITIEKINSILNGIDKTEDDPDGWWETSTGAEFGRKKLNELLSLLTIKK